MEERLTRTARNESLLREVNDRIEELSENVEAQGIAPEGGLVEFHCECGRDVCGERIQMTVAEYEHVRADNDRFAVVPGHETPEMEAVVESNERFIVVDKLPEAEPLVGADGRPRSGS
jgi:hypothetical protein